MYKIKLSKQQITTIYDITDNKDKQNKLMSILSYLIKYTKENKLTKSLNRLYTMYIRLEYRKITRSYFYKLVNLLKEYNLFTAIEDKIKDKTEDKENVAETFENTNVECASEKHNNLTPNPNIYINIPNTSDDVIEIAKEILKDMDIKSKYIRSLVINSLATAKIDSKGMISYIYAVILEKIKVYYKARDKYKQKVIETRNSYDFAYSKNTYYKKSKGIPFVDNCETRAEYSDPAYFKFLEDNLL